MLAALRYLTGDADGGGACARLLMEQRLLLQVVGVCVCVCVCVCMCVCVYVYVYVYVCMCV